MREHYIWLYNHLDKYRYITDDAKKLYMEYKQIDILKTPMSEETISKLESCYERFLKMFNNNPHSYKNSLIESEIETAEFECYFLKANEQLYPIGFYNETRPAEGVAWLIEKAERQQNYMQKLKLKVLDKMKKDEVYIKSGYDYFKDSKKAFFIRALLASAACIVILWFSIMFFVKTDVVNILKNIGNGQEFINSAINGMNKIPLLSGMGHIGWIALLLIHILLIIWISFKIKSIISEYKLAYKKYVTAGFGRYIQKCVKKIDSELDGIAKQSTEQFLDLSRKGKNANIAKSSIAAVMRIYRKKLKKSSEYIKIPKTLLRGIKENKTIVLLLLTAVLNVLVYNSWSDGVFVKEKIYEFQVNSDTFFLRGKKLAVIDGETCPIYERASLDSRVKNTLPNLTVVEIVKKKAVENDTFCKIKLINDQEVISGWVHRNYLVPFALDDYSKYTEIGISGASASSYLEGNKNKYTPDMAFDWNRKTSWQDGLENSNGKGEYLTLEFETPQTVEFLQIFPGNAKSRELYQQNERIKKARIKFSNGKSVTYEFDDDYNQKYQFIWLNKPVETQSIKIEVLEVYPGETYMDLCVSEVHAYRRGE